MANSAKHVPVSPNVRPHLLGFTMRWLGHPLLLCGVGIVAATTIARVAAGRLVDPANSIVHRDAPATAIVPSTSPASNSQSHLPVARNRPIGDQASPEVMASQPTQSPRISYGQPISPSGGVLSGNTGNIGNTGNNSNSFIQSNPNSNAGSSFIQTTAPHTAQLRETSGGWTLPWSFGATALGCAAGCLILTRYLNLRTRRPVTAGNSHSALAVAVPRQPRSLSPAARRAGTPQSLPSATTAPSQAAVTVLPADAVHPLDWGEDSLVHQMDLRKSYPVSYWL